MKNDTVNKMDNTADEVVIPDECGDTLWDAVLQQEVKACEVNVTSKNAAALLNSIDAVQVCDATKAK